MEELTEYLLYKVYIKDSCILEQSFSSFALDAVLDSVLMLIVCFAVYTAVSYGAVMLIFRKKELSF